MCKTDTQSDTHDRTKDGIGPHMDVVAVPGAPPFFSCQTCHAYRTTHAGLRDLPCEPDRYRDVTASKRVHVGQQVQARVDQVLVCENDSLDVLAHTVETGVRLRFQTDELVARGDLLAVEITDTHDGVAEANIDEIASTAERIRPPKPVRDRRSEK